MKQFVVVKIGDIWQSPIVLDFKNFNEARKWCNDNNFDIIEEL